MSGALASVVSTASLGCGRSASRAPPEEPLISSPNDRNDRTDRTERTERARLARALDVDAGVLVDPAAPLAPPAPPGDLAAEVAAFTTLEACVREHASKDPLVSDALSALGYDTFLRDACRTLEAARTKSAKPCALIDASGLRRECRTTLAMVTATADICPLRVDDAAFLGRDPTCLAVASGDVRLCASEARERRARCEALATHDEARCAAIGSGRAACDRDVARWRRALTATLEKAPPFKVSARATVAIAASTPNAAILAVDLGRIAAAGVVLVKGPTGVAYQVGVPRESGAAPFASSPEMGPRLAFRVVVARTGAATLEHLEVDVPGRASLVVPPLRFEGTARLTGAEKRGDATTLTVHGTIVAAPSAYDLDVVMETFIVDEIDHDCSPVGPER